MVVVDFHTFETQWIERIGDLAAETGLFLHAGTSNRAPGK